MGARALARLWLLRSAVLCLWSLLLWGALLVLVMVQDAAREGLRPALDRLLPSPGASVWQWLNALSAALALAVGIVAGGVLAWGRWAGRRTRTSGPQGRE